MQKESFDNNNNISIKELKEKIETMEQTMFLMDQKIERLLELMEKDCKKMTDHIDFVESVYESVKTPFTFIMDSVNRVAHPVLMQGSMQGSSEDVEDINI